MKIGNAVVSVRRAFDCCLIDAIFDKETCKRRTSAYRLAHYDVSPRRGHAIRTNADLDAMHMHRTIVATADIIFTCPNELNRRAAKTLRNHSRFVLHM